MWHQFKKRLNTETQYTRLALAFGSCFLCLTSSLPQFSAHHHHWFGQAPHMFYFLSSCLTSTPISLPSNAPNLICLKYVLEYGGKVVLCVYVFLTYKRYCAIGPVLVLKFLKTILCFKQIFLLLYMHLIHCFYTVFYILLPNSGSAVCHSKGNNLRGKCQ